MSRRYTLDLGTDRTGWLGFYGCAGDGRSRIVCVAFVGEGRPPYSAKVACPVCAAEHDITPMWRRPIEADQGREPDLVIETEAARP